MDSVTLHEKVCSSHYPLCLCYYVANDGREIGLYEYKCNEHHQIARSQQEPRIGDVCDMPFL